MIPRLRFANLPTPVETMSRLSAALNAPRLLIKRDDLTGLALGGNKTRKLEFLIAEAQAGGADTLITAGESLPADCRGCGPFWHALCSGSGWRSPGAAFGELFA